MKSFLKISAILFIVILLVTTVTTIWLIYDGIVAEQKSPDDILSFSPGMIVVFTLIIVTPCYIAECIVYKEIRYFVARKNKKRLVIFLRLISLLFAVVVFLGYFEGFLWVCKIPPGIISELLSAIPFKFTAYSLLIGIPVNLILPFVIKSVEGNTSDELQSGNNVGNYQ